jgi:KDO2-lipid IV(A) lauroyltransferase
MIALRLARDVAGALPEPLARRAGAGLGRLAHRLDGPRRRMARRHMRRLLGPGADADAAAREVFAHYGRAWAELFWLRPRRHRALLDHVRWEGREHVEAARSAGRGLIFALPHLGSWDLAGAAAAAAGIELLAVAERPPDAREAAWFQSLRGALGVEVLFAEDGVATAKRLLRRLGGGDAVALLCDRDLPGHGVEVRFFGETTTLPRGPVALALRTGAALLPTAVYQQPGRGHRIVIGAPLALPLSGPTATRIAGGTQRLATALEALIRAAPTQWLVLQPNWPSDRTAP